jgi:hypothetical protein
MQQSCIIQICSKGCLVVIFLPQLERLGRVAGAASSTCTFATATFLCLFGTGFEALDKARFVPCLAYF